MKRELVTATARTPGSGALTVAPRNAGLLVGVSGATRNAAVAACVDGELVAVCEQERLTGTRGVGLQPSNLPSQALQAVLRLAGDRSIDEVRQFATAEEELHLPSHIPALRFDHHFAHAVTAYVLSPFENGMVLVSDHHSSPPTSVWSSHAGGLIGIDWPSSSSSLAGLYSECARLFGFDVGQEHRLEALARLDGNSNESRFDNLIRYDDGVVTASSKWRAVVRDWLAEKQNVEHRIRVAGAFQRHLGRLLLALAADVRAAASSEFLCVGGGLFYNTYFTTIIRESGLFQDVFVAPNPGNPGLAVGAALAASEAQQKVGSVDAPSPFLGPGYDLEDIKLTLDNCKLSYEYLTENQVINQTVDALQKGRLVGWFQGRMEWAHRALGNRSILASPLSPYVLDNLNVFLKHRERHCAYGLSVPACEASRFFKGPPLSPFMEYEYGLRSDGIFTHAVAKGATTLRVQTVSDRDAAFRRFHLLHEAFGQASGVPVLVNTSFNGFSEPIVCSPRDAVRVFYSTGLDLLVLDRFLIRK